MPIQATSASTPAEATPRQAVEIINNLMSPFCPGLTLAACPSPSADSLRTDIIARARAGESKDSIVHRLYTDFGSAIRGAPAFESFGIIAWLAPGFFIICGAVLLTAWLRRNARKPAIASIPNDMAGARLINNLSTTDHITDAERSHLQRLLKSDNSD